MVPPPVPATLPAHSQLFALARRELQILSEAVKAAPDHSNLLMHMLNHYGHQRQRALNACHAAEARRTCAHNPL